MKPVRNASMTALLILAATAIGLLLAELGVRFSALAAEPVAASGARAPLDPALRGLPILKQKIRRPNVRGIHYGVLHRTNSRGVRGPEYAAEPAEGTFRIVLVGDSFAMGHRVDEAETYAALTEQSLNRGDADLHFEIINAGLSGLNINAVVGRLEAVGLPYLPDLIVYGFTPNDIYGPEYGPNTQAQRDAFASERARFDDSGLYLLRWVWPRWISLRSALDPLPGSHELALNRNYFENPAAWAEIDRGFARRG